MKNAIHKYGSLYQTLKQAKLDPEAGWIGP